MAEISRNSEENSVEIFKGFHKSKFSQDLDYTKVSSSKLELIKDKKSKILGVKFNEFFEKIEIASYYAENLMKQNLERSKYFSLYLGMHFEINEKDSNFHLNIGNTRPDFLVNNPNVGNYFIDVKCRKQYSFMLEEEKQVKVEVKAQQKSKVKAKNSKIDKYKKVIEKNEILFFNITRDEILELLSIQKQLKIPIILAIKDFNQFDIVKKSFTDNNKFYYISVSVLNNYLLKLNSSAKKYSKLFYSYKIPLSIFEYSADLTSIKFDYKFGNKMIKKMAEISIQSLTIISKVILKMIGEERTYKTYISYILSGSSSTNIKSKFNGALNNFSVQDIQSVLWNMIDSKEIKYEKGKVLEVGTKKKEG